MVHLDLLTPCFVCLAINAVPNMSYESHLETWGAFKTAIAINKQEIVKQVLVRDGCADFYSSTLSCYEFQLEVCIICQHESISAGKRSDEAGYPNGLDLVYAGEADPTP